MNLNIYDNNYNVIEAIEINTRKDFKILVDCYGKMGNNGFKNLRIETNSSLYKLITMLFSTSKEPMLIDEFGSYTIDPKNIHVSWYVSDEEEEIHVIISDSLNDDSFCPIDEKILKIDMNEAFFEISFKEKGDCLHLDFSDKDLILFVL